MNITKKTMEQLELIEIEIEKQTRLRKEIINALLDLVPANEKLLIDEIYEVKHIQYPTERFSLKEAEKILDKRQLKPFISQSITNRIDYKKVA